MRTYFDDNIGKVIVIDETPIDIPQAFDICVKDPADWEEIHNYIISENEIDGIPNRAIKCITELKCSSKRSTYSMSEEEAEVLRNHSKVEWVTKSTLYNPVTALQRKYDDEFKDLLFENRYKQNIANKRIYETYDGFVKSRLDYTQWGIYRHATPTNNFVGVGTTTTNADIPYSLSGKNVDVVIMDCGIRWQHPEFLRAGITTVPVGVSTVTVSRVKDILLHGPSEFGFTWTAEGLVQPGAGSLSNYNERNVLTNATTEHGTHVAGITVGNNFGHAFESNIWSIAFVSNPTLSIADPSDAFDYIRVWHKNKPINPVTGKKNPTIVNGSWGFINAIRFSDPNNLGLSTTYTAVFRGVSYASTDIAANLNFLPPVTYMHRATATSAFYEFTAKNPTSQTKLDEFFDDPDCKNVTVVFASGNSGDGNGKQDVPGGVDYNNVFLNGNVVFPSYDAYFNRPGTPGITHLGQDDAPITVGSLDSTIITSGISSERKSSFSNNGPAIDVWAAGSNIISPIIGYTVGPNTAISFKDPRNPNFFMGYLSGTSMASPQVTGVLALYLQSNPLANRVDVRKWLFRHGSVVLDSGPGTTFYDQYKNDNPVGAGTSVNYWDDSYGMRGSTPRILYNPFANNTIPSISGVDISGVSFTQS